MKFLLLIMLLGARSVCAQRHYTEKQVISYAEAIDVHSLDPSLPSRGLDDWLRHGPPQAKVEWTVAGTCDNKPFRNEDYPLCAKIWFSRNGEAGSILIEVGTKRRGIFGVPKLHDEVLSWEEGTWIMTDGASKLSGLTAILDDPAYAHSVGSLYGQIVEHHPIGIPSDAELNTMRPFLSKRLLNLFQTARACEADYLLKLTSLKEQTAKPGWLKSDLFTGDRGRVAPASAWPVRQGKLKDGSFLVLVNLFGQTIDLGSGLKGGSASGGTWHTEARVIFEGEHFVIDDVRLFDGPLTEGPSHLLSESFVGCDGPRWRM